jgi:predicted ferric reductase
MTTVTSSTAALAARATRPGRRSARDAAVRTGAGLTLWAALLLVTYWWVADGGLGDLSGWASGLTSVGRVTGLVASVLLLAQVLLMARVPLLERAFGQDRLAGIHRLVGFTSFNLMLAHVGLITWGYAAGDLGSVPGSAWRLTVDYPGMLLAVAGSLCLVLVVVTSVRAARRRLRYESWHLLHLYAYLGAGLALPHQLWTGADFLGSPLRTAFWWTAWGVCAGAVLLWRLGLPVVRNLRHGLRVTSVVPEGPGVVSVYVTGRRLDRLRVEAGQFLLWRFLGAPGQSRAHPYSLSAAPDGHSLRITVQAVGDDSAGVRHLRPGSRVLVEGPYGRLGTRTTRKVALVGAGVGMAPIRALAEGLDYAPGEAVLVHRYRDHRLYAGELDQLARERGLRQLLLPGRRHHTGSWIGAAAGAGSDLDALRAWIPDIAERDVYLCGPPAWADLVRADLQLAGLPPDRLHLETFGW